MKCQHYGSEHFHHPDTIFELIRIFVIILFLIAAKKSKPVSNHMHVSHLKCGLLLHSQHENIRCCDYQLRVKKKFDRSGKNVTDDFAAF